MYASDTSIKITVIEQDDAAEDRYKMEQAKAQPLAKGRKAMSLMATGPMHS